MPGPMQAGALRRTYNGGLQSAIAAGHQGCLPWKPFIT